MNKELTLEEAENIVDNMYQNRWIECGIEDGNTIHMGNLDNLQYNELESASILLLRTELRLQRENQKYKEVIDKAIDVLNKMIYQGYVDENNTQYFSTGNKSEFGVRAIKILDILKEVDSDEIIR